MTATTLTGNLNGKSTILCTHGSGVSTAPVALGTRLGETPPTCKWGFVAGGVSEPSQSLILGEYKPGNTTKLIAAKPEGWRICRQARENLLLGRSKNQ